MVDDKLYVESTERKGGCYENFNCKPGCREKKKKKSFLVCIKKNLPLTIMAAPGLIVMILFRSPSDVGTASRI